jgi:hypothetical protein
MSDYLIPVRLRDGSVLHVQGETQGERFPVSTGGEYDFGEVEKILRDLGGSLGEVISSLKPKKGSVEIGLEITAGVSGLIAILCKGETKANLKVVLEWGI